MTDFNGFLDASKEEMYAFLKEIIPFKSISHDGDEGYPYGREVSDCLSCFLDKAESMGFSTGVMDGRCGWVEYGSGDEMEAVVCHLDVVPEGEGWTHEPFKADDCGGRIYGRGAIDDKGPAAASLYALKAVKDSGLKINKRIRLILGCSEELGADDMEYYVENGGEIPVCGFTPDGEYPLINGEKGIIIETYRCEIQSGVFKEISGGTASNIVPNHAKAVLGNGTVICADGISVHGSTPEKGLNAIGKLFLELKKLPLEGSARQAVDFIADKIGTEYNGASLGVAMEDSVSGALTFNLGVVRCDGSSIEVDVNYRYPVTKSMDMCVPVVNEAFESAGFTLVSSSRMESLYIPADDSLVVNLMDVYNSYTGQNEKPICIGGGTYAKSLPNILAFGPVFPGEEATEHQADEYIDKEHMLDMAKMTAMAMYRLAL